MRLRLDLSKTIFYFKVSGYVKSTKLDWDNKWCITDGCIENPYLHIDIQGEVLLSSEIDSLADGLDDLLNGRLSDTRIIECVEPVLSFVLYSKEDLRKKSPLLSMQEERDIKDVCAKMIVHLWADGALTENSIHLSLTRYDIQALLVYLRYVKHEVSAQSTEVSELIKTGILHEEYS